MQRNMRHTVSSICIRLCMMTQCVWTLLYKSMCSITTLPYVAVGLHQCTTMYAVWTGLNVGILHPGSAHALATVTAVLYTTRWSPNVSLSRVSCCWAISSGMGGELCSQHSYQECRIAVHWARTVVQCSFIPDDSNWLHGWQARWVYWYKWSYTGCSYQSPARFRLADDSRENGWSIGALIQNQSTASKLYSFWDFVKEPL